MKREGEHVDIVRMIVDYSTSMISSGGISLGFLIVFVGCFIPILPLSVFIALTVNAFGLFTGVLVSWASTVLGSYLCYLLFFYLEDKIAKRIIRFRIMRETKKRISIFQKISFSNLVLLITLPFTPAYLINMVGGLARIPKEKFAISLIIGKVFSTIFWGYIGKSLLSSLTDATSLIFIFITLIIAYILSRVIGKKFNIM